LICHRLDRNQALFTALQHMELLIIHQGETLFMKKEVRNLNDLIVLWDMISIYSHSRSNVFGDARF